MRAILLAAIILPASTTLAKSHNSVSPECARSLVLAASRLNATIDKNLAARVANGDDYRQLYEQYLALLGDYTSLTEVANGMINACKP